MLALILMLPAGAADNSGVVVREARVYSEANASSAAVARLEAGTRVDIFSRAGGWKEIYSEQPPATGWVRSYMVREGNYQPEGESAAESDSRGFLAGLASLSRKASSFFSIDRNSTSSGTATIGVRGLSEEEIRTAKPDFAEFEKMDGYASGKKRARRFARQGELAAAKVPYISGAK
ncbi:MAG: hypothetical protein PVI79_11570 [Gammaproteobacteria bacterium]